MIRCLAAVFGALIFVVSAGSVSAQTISQPNGNNIGGAVGFGQTFTATVTGTVTQIQVRPRTTASGVHFYFFDGPGSATAGSTADAASSQLVNLVDTGDNASGFQTITLTTPLPVVAGHQYAFAVTEVVAFAVDTNNPYVGGDAIGDYNDPYGFDMAFTVTEVAAPVTVPTLTEWAMILFGVMLAGGAAVMVQRRRLAV